MKNTIKFLTGIALIAVIVFSMAACNGFGDDGIDSDLNGTWIDEDENGDEIKFNNGSFSSKSLKGTYTTSGNEITITPTQVHGDITYGMLESRWYTKTEMKTAMLHIGKLTDEEINVYIDKVFAQRTGTYSVKSNTLVITFTNTDEYGHTEFFTSTYAKKVPAVPTGVTATATSSNSITIKWSAVSEASGYYVYRSLSYSGTYVRVGESSSNSYTNTGLSPNTTYYYKVSARNSNGESVQSYYASATTLSSSLVDGLAVPSNVTAAAASSSSITITWSSVSGARGYFLYRSSSYSGQYDIIDFSSYNYYIDTELSANTTYYYKVSAYNNNSESSLSAYAYATTLSSSSSGAIDLTSNSWYSNTISGGATHTYRFYAYSGSTYNIQWNDIDNSIYIADVKVGLRREADSSYVVNVENRKQTNAFTYSVTTSGYYIIEVQAYDDYDGDYRVRYY